MRMIVGRHEISIIAENEEDQAYIEDTLGLKDYEEHVYLVRVSKWPEPAYLKTQKTLKKKGESQ